MHNKCGNNALIQYYGKPSVLVHCKTKNLDFFFPFTKQKSFWENNKLILRIKVSMLKGEKAHKINKKLLQN